MASNALSEDPEWCGGVSELTKICALASIYDVQVTPRGHALHAAMHVAASQWPMICPLVKYVVLKMGSWQEFEKYPPVWNGAKIAVSDRTGFGIELDTAKDRETDTNALELII